MNYCITPCIFVTYIFIVNLYGFNRELFLNISLARQCSARGGDLKVSVSDNGRLVLAGHAVTVLRGSIKYS